MNLEQLNQDVCIYVGHEDEFYQSNVRLDFADEGWCDVLDEGHPVMVLGVVNPPK